MVRHTDRSEFVERVSEQRSNQEQYDSFSVEIPESDERMDIALGYRRCHDFDAGNQPGQDFAVVRCGGGLVVGVVADGVSQSFYGDIAARHVSTSLLDALWENRNRPPGEHQLEDKLRQLEGSVAALVEDFPLPPHLPDMQRFALESARKQGSQAVFAAFVLNGMSKNLRLYQIGDVIAMIHYPKTLPEISKAPAKGRWSSAGMSKFLLLVSDYRGATGVVIKSDGASDDLGTRLTSDAINEDSFRYAAEKLAGVDDLSFIAVAIRKKGVPRRLGESRSPQRHSGITSQNEAGQSQKGFVKREETSDEGPLMTTAPHLRGIALFAAGFAVGTFAGVIMMVLVHIILMDIGVAKKPTNVEFLTTGIVLGFAAGVAIMSIVCLLLSIWNLTEEVP